MTPLELLGVRVEVPANTPMVLLQSQLDDHRLLPIYIGSSEASSIHYAIEGLEPAQSRSVALKAPLTLDFELRDGTEALATVAAVELKRKTGVTIVLTELDGAYFAAAVPNIYIR